MPVRRVSKLLEWVREGEYDAIVRGEFIRRGDEASAREEADAAGDYYSDRIAGAFQQAGSSIGEVGEQLRDWLKRNRDR